MSIKQKISDNYYEIYVESYPDRVGLRLYRGDLFSFTIVGFNNDDSPFDFNVYDTFSAQIRFNASSTGDPDYEFTEDEIILGKVNSASSIYDELHCVSKDAVNLLVEGNHKVAWFDVQGSIDGEIKTFIKIKFKIETDVTR